MPNSTGVEVRVEARHILRGRVGDCHACPVALALVDALGLTTAPVVRLDTITVGGAVYPVGPTLGRWIRRYDRDSTKAVPVTFRLGEMA